MINSRLFWCVEEIKLMFSVFKEKQIIQLIDGRVYLCALLIQQYGSTKLNLKANYILEISSTVKTVLGRCVVKVPIWTPDLYKGATKYEKIYNFSFWCCGLSSFVCPPHNEKNLYAF